MGWADTVSNVSIRFYEAIRSERADEAAATPASGTLASLHGHRHALVVTYRRDGQPVPTPVWFGLSDDRLYFRSIATAHKLRRIAHDPAVLVAPCTTGGRPTGPPVRARARVLTAPDDEATAERAIRANYGIGRRLYVRLVGTRVPGRYVEVEPAS